MRSRFWTMICLCTIAAAINMLMITVSGSEEAAKISTESEKDNRVTVAEARRQARLLHDTYEATLHVVHRTDFEEGKRITIPARALEDIFSLAISVEM